MKSVGPSATCNDASLRENGEELVNVRDYERSVVIDIEPVSKGMQRLQKDTCYVRKSVAEKIARVQRRLPKGVKLKIIDGYRPLSAQKRIYGQYFRQLRSEHPGWSRSEVIKELDRWVTNPYTQIPPHSTGGTLDLTLEDSSGAELDMGTPVNTADSERACTLSKKIPSKATRNRALLIKSMSKEGFVNYSLEWWHWSYGDWRWAIANKTQAIYGIADKFRSTGKRRK